MVRAGLAKPRDSSKNEWIAKRLMMGELSMLGKHVTRLLALLRRLGYHYDGKTHWTQSHQNYLRGLKLPDAAHTGSRGG